MWSGAACCGPLLARHSPSRVCLCACVCSPFTGVEIKLDGFNHKLPVLAHRILSVLAEAQFTGASWPTVHEAACRKYKNMNMQV